jgi:hypothetical protein
MSNSPESLVEAAAAVATLGVCQSDIDLLDEASLVVGMGYLRELDRQAQTYRLWFAAAIARQSDHTLGYDGLARRSGSATPAIFIQSMTGSSIEEATKLARLGQSIVDAQDAPAAAAPTSPLVEAAVSGAISVDAADAIRRGLGQPEDAVTAAQLAAAAEELIARADALTPEALLKAARRARNDLDLDAIERGEKARAAIRYVRLWQRDGMSGGSWALPDEDGGLEVHNAMKLLVARKTNGPRFPDAHKGQVTKETGPVADSSEPQASSGTRPQASSGTEPQASSGSIPEDERSPEHIMADGFVQIFHNGITADPGVVPGAGRAPVRVIVPASTLTNRAGNGPGPGTTPSGMEPSGSNPSGSALLEETMSAISFGKLGEYLCEGGTIGILFDNHGHILDAGREQRLFTKTQRTALGVRDGGCRYPGCDKPPSWCEAHHILNWARDHGPTDISNGILLCRYHHMLIHTNGWEIIKDGHGGYWLKPPKNQDPRQQLIEMPSKNPLIAAMQHANKADQQLVS